MKEISFHLILIEVFPFLSKLNINFEKRIEQKLLTENVSEKIFSIKLEMKFCFSKKMNQV